jgi:hypothetical protein
MGAFWDEVAVGAHVKSFGQLGTVELLRDLRYAVVDAEGARRVDKTADETEPPDDDV